MGQPFIMNDRYCLLLIKYHGFNYSSDSDNTSSDRCQEKCLNGRKPLTCKLRFLMFNELISTIALTLILHPTGVVEEVGVGQQGEVNSWT